MKIAVEISMYPLASEYLAPIQGFIDRVRANEKLEVLVNTMSTQILGEMSEVFATLQQEMRVSFEAGNPTVFVTKFLGPTEHR
jgi:uncharacterized protein YqgV (UPF0045/DUF77 family)